MNLGSILTLLRPILRGMLYAYIGHFLAQHGITLPAALTGGADTGSLLPMLTAGLGMGADKHIVRALAGDVLATLATPAPWK